MMIHLLPGLLVAVLGLAILATALSGLLSVLGGAQFVRTPSRVFPTIKRLARLRSGDLFVELGSGDGGLCRYLASQTEARVVGIDINPLLIMLARWQGRHLRNCQFRWQIIDQVDLSKAKVVYCYLLPPMLRTLVRHFEAELPRGARVISYAFPLAGLKPDQKIPATRATDALYLYRF